MRCYCSKIVDARFMPTRMRGTTHSISDLGVLFIKMIPICQQRQQVCKHFHYKGASTVSIDGGCTGTTLTNCGNFGLK